MKNPTMTFVDEIIDYHPERKCFIDFIFVGHEEVELINESHKWSATLSIKYNPLYLPAIQLLKGMVITTE